MIFMISHNVFLFNQFIARDNILSHVEKCVCLWAPTNGIFRFWFDDQGDNENKTSQSDNI